VAIQEGPQTSSSETRQETKYALSRQTRLAHQGQTSQLFSTPPRLRDDTDINQWHEQLSNWFLSQRALRVKHANGLPLGPAALLPMRYHPSLDDLCTDDRSSDLLRDFHRTDVDRCSHQPLIGKTQRDQVHEVAASNCGSCVRGSPRNLDGGACQQEQCDDAGDASCPLRGPEPKAGDLVTDSQALHTSMFLARSSYSVSEEGSSQSGEAVMSKDDIWRMLTCSDQSVHEPGLARPPHSRKIMHVHAQNRRRKKCGRQTEHHCPDMSFARAWLEEMMVQPVTTIHSIASLESPRVAKEKIAGVSLYMPQKQQQGRRPADSVGKRCMLNRVTCNSDANVNWTASSLGQDFLLGTLAAAKATIAEDDW